VKALSERFKFQRDHAQLYESLGASMAEEVRGRMNRRLGPDVGEVRVGQIPVPVLVPLADGASPGRGRCKHPMIPECPNENLVC
jgi:hypothetical protein